MDCQAKGCNIGLLGLAIAFLQHINRIKKWEWNQGILMNEEDSVPYAHGFLCWLQLRTLECLINVPVRVFISRKMPPYTGLIWHYTFIFSLHILATQFLTNTTNSPDLVVNKSWYLYNLSLGRLLEGDPLKCCLLIQAAGTGSDCASSNFAYNL